MADTAATAELVEAAASKLSAINVLDTQPGSPGIPAGSPTAEALTTSYRSDPSTPTAASPHSLGHPIIRENAPITPRRYIKALQGIMRQVDKHSLLLPAAAKEARKVSGRSVSESALPAGCKPDNDATVAIGQELALQFQM
jgi:hypothetical protein